MYRLQLLILLTCMATAVAVAQDDETGPDDAARAEEEEAAPPAEEVTDEEIEALLGLDEDYTEAEDDDFDPTVEVRFEQSINFPTDI